jgi:choline dehydrogenase-like flavoprotein
VVVGSGFGGSVPALRLAEKGYDVLVLEQGCRFEDADFAKTAREVRKSLWLPRLCLRGLNTEIADGTPPRLTSRLPTASRRSPRSTWTGIRSPRCSRR